MFTHRTASRLALQLLMLILLGCNHLNAQKRASEPAKEMRGVWIASIANIDWPSKPGLSINALKQETSQILDHLKQLGINCIFLQVRPSADALYASALEPWAACLTGLQGVAPPQNFDPLSFWIEQSHQRGMELHAWINPFRATSKAAEVTAPNHIRQTHPEWMVKFNDKLFLNPGIPAARDHLQLIVADLVTRYDIDGLHLDDYFYPYPSKNEQFNDQDAFAAYNPGAAPLDDWRRNNIDQFIQQTQLTISKLKPWVMFGVSPFGVWRNQSGHPQGSATTAGTTAFDHLFADVKKWTEKKWIDYVIPQIYWETTHPSANFVTLTQWWNALPGCDKFVGHALYKIDQGNKTWGDPKEMNRQMEEVRKNKNLKGSVFFSYNHFKRDLNGFQDELRQKWYSTPVRTPFEPKGTRNQTEVTKLKQKKHRLYWHTNGKDPVRFYAVYSTPAKNKNRKSQPPRLIEITSQPFVELPSAPSKTKERIQVSTITPWRKEGALSKPIKVRF